MVVSVNLTDSRVTQEIGFWAHLLGDYFDRVN